MKPPVTHDQLDEMWSQDVKIDRMDPSGELLRLPLIHAKYLRIEQYHSLKSKKLYSDYLKKKVFKHEYYAGDLNNPDDLRTYDLKPMTKMIKNKADETIYLDGDDDLNDILLKKQYHDEIVKSCDRIFWEIKGMRDSIRGYIDWEKYISGK